MLPRSAQGSDAATLSYLQRVISDAETQRGYVFLSDQDNGGRGGPDSSGGIRGLDWRASQWDNGMDPAEAVRTGADQRLVPILMTALATALALVPLALAGGQPGSEIQAPMAIVILCGLITSTALNMIVVPALYLRFGAACRS